jgi:hypothetical protein
VIAAIANLHRRRALACTWVHRSREGHHPFACLAGNRDGTVDSRLNLGAGQTNVPQFAVVEIVKAGNGGATVEIAR